MGRCPEAPAGEASMAPAAPAAEVSPAARMLTSQPTAPVGVPVPVDRDAGRDRAGCRCDASLLHSASPARRGHFEPLSQRNRGRPPRRQGRDMPHPAPAAVPDRHADHDLLAFVSAHAAGDGAGHELDVALALVAACPDCAALHHDLRAIAVATARPAGPRPHPGLPPHPPTRPPRSRPAGWRRRLARSPDPKFAFAGPVGAGLATLGLAGILVGGIVRRPPRRTAPTDGGAAAASDAVAVEMAPQMAPESAAAASMAPADAEGPVHRCSESQAASPGPSRGRRHRRRGPIR